MTYTWDSSETIHDPVTSASAASPAAGSSHWWWNNASFVPPHPCRATWLWVSTSAMARLVKGQRLPVTTKPALEIITILGKALTKPKRKLKDMEKSTFRAARSNDCQLMFSRMPEFLTLMVSKHQVLKCHWFHRKALMCFGIGSAPYGYVPGLKLV